jgi:hypothetical protein
MPPTPLTPTVRYIPPGTRRIYWLTTIASYATAVTRAEINAGIELTNEIASMSGFTVTSDSTETPDLSGRFVSKIPGRIKADDSSMSFYASSTSADVRTVLPRDTAGYVIILPEGDVPTQRMDVFPAKVSSAAVDTTMEDPAQINVQFTVTRVPALNLVIPA